ncbi:MAG TPA: RHS repeat-associated core domain-containing protein [Kineosporiaceae bacterium]
MRYYTLGDTVAERTTGVTSPGLHWLLSDRQNSVSIAVNATTAAISRDRYLPYGGNRATNFTLPTDRGWIGQVQDKDTGLDYLNARYYDPQLAHFISTDPLNVQSSPEDANPYAADSPIARSDASGLVALIDHTPVHVALQREAVAARARAEAQKRAAEASALKARIAAAVAKAKAAKEAAANRAAQARVAAEKKKSLLDHLNDIAMAAVMIGRVPGEDGEGVPGGSRIPAAKINELSRADLAELADEGLTVEQYDALNTNNLGLVREVHVAKLTGGSALTLATGRGVKVVQPARGSTDIDVVAGNGDFIAVGGPKKTPQVVGSKLRILKYAADEAGVGAQAWFELGTSEQTLDKAREILGAGNVHVFSSRPPLMA